MKNRIPRRDFLKTARAAAGLFVYAAQAPAATVDQSGGAKWGCFRTPLNGARDELVLLYRGLRATGAVDFGDAGVADNFSYWASSQQTTDMASHVDFADSGRLHSDDKDFPRRVRAIRTI